MGVLIGDQPCQLGPVDLTGHVLEGAGFAAAGLLAPQAVDLRDDGAQRFERLAKGLADRVRVDPVGQQGRFEGRAARQQPASTDVACQAFEGVDQGLQLVGLQAQGLELLAEVALGARKALEQTPVEL